MNNTSAYECQECGVELDNALIGYCDDCGRKFKSHTDFMNKMIRKIAKREQDFDTSPLPLFGDAHLQRELF